MPKSFYLHTDEQLGGDKRSNINQQARETDIRM